MRLLVGGSGGGVHRCFPRRIVGGDRSPYSGNSGIGILCGRFEPLKRGFGIDCDFRWARGGVDNGRHLAGVGRFPTFEAQYATWLPVRCDFLRLGGDRSVAGPDPGKRNLLTGRRYARTILRAEPEYFFPMVRARMPEPELLGQTAYFASSRYAELPTSDVRPDVGPCLVCKLLFFRPLSLTTALGFRRTLAPALLPTAPAFRALDPRRVSREAYALPGTSDASVPTPTRRRFPGKSSVEGHTR
jgi:hypothetical protein